MEPTRRLAVVDRHTRMDRAPIVREKATGHALGIVIPSDTGTGYSAVHHFGSEYAPTEEAGVEILLSRTNTQLPEGVTP